MKKYLISTTDLETDVGSLFTVTARNAQDALAQGVRKAFPARGKRRDVLKVQITVELREDLKR